MVALQCVFSYEPPGKAFDKMLLHTLNLLNEQKLLLNAYQTLKNTKKAPFKTR